MLKEDYHPENPLPADNQYSLEEKDFEDDTKILYQVWLNERLAPTLLPFAGETVDNIIELISNQQALMEEQQSDTAQQVSYINCLYQMEIERLQYLLSSYLRCRLAKIEAHWLYWASGTFDVLNTLFHPAELRFLKRYCQARVRAFESSILHNLPPSIADFPTSYTNPPNTKAHVICRVCKDLGPVLVDPSGMVADLLKGDIYVIQYSIAEPLLLGNQISLL